MRVLVILKYIPSRDGELKSELLWSVVDGLSSVGVNVTLMTQGQSNVHEFPEVPSSPRTSLTLALEYLARLVRRAGFSSLGDKFRDLSLSMTVARWCRKHGAFDAVIALCTADHPALLASCVSSALAIPYAVQEHKNYERMVSSIEKLPRDYVSALRSASAVVAVSPYLSDMMKKVGVRGDVGVIPNGLSDEFFQPPESYCKKVEEVRVWSEGCYLFGGWTRWREIKRVDLLLQAFLEVREIKPDARLVVVGPIEPAFNEAEAIVFIKGNGLQDAVWLFGSASRDEIHQIAYTVDCCVLPSDYETFGLPALEAQAAGKPVVTTRCNGPEMLVTEPSLGEVVGRDDHAELASAMCAVMERRYSFNSEYIRRHAFDGYSSTAVAQQWKQLLDKIIAYAR